MKKFTISMIVAMDEKRGIGKSNALMWHIPGELKRFKEITLGFPIIMGRKTHESIGRVLPGRTNIIISRSSDYKVDGATIVSSLQDAVNFAAKENPKEVFIIGGGQLFEHALPFTNRIYITLVKGNFGADVFFPEYSQFKKIISKEHIKTDLFDYEYITLEK